MASTVGSMWNLVRKPQTIAQARQQRKISELMLLGALLLLVLGAVKASGTIIISAALIAVGALMMWRDARRFIYRD